jgi:hypothetical protein
MDTVEFIEKIRGLELDNFLIMMKNNTSTDKISNGTRGPKTLKWNINVLGIAKL